MDKHFILKELESRGMSLWDFSQMSKIPHTTLHRIVNGGKPRKKTAAKIVKKSIGISMKDFGFED